MIIGLLSIFLVVTISNVILARGTLPEPITLDDVVRADDAYIGLFMYPHVQTAVSDSARASAARWSNILKDMVPPRSSFSPGFDLCDRKFEFSENTTLMTQLDFLAIAVNVTIVDGPGDFPSQSGICERIVSGFFPLYAGKPTFGLIEVDEDDLSDLIYDDVLEDLIAHEMGHILGIGTLWPLATQGRLNFDLPSGTVLIENPIFELQSPARRFEYIFSQCIVDPSFVGSNAVMEYGKLTGQTESSVPVEDGTDNGYEIAAGGRWNSLGISDVHWDKDVFNNELMTYELDVGAGNRPISNMTIASLEDLGYIVDYSAGEPFSLNSNNHHHNLRRKNKNYKLGKVITSKIV